MVTKSDQIGIKVTKSDRIILWRNLSRDGTTTTAIYTSEIYGLLSSGDQKVTKIVM